MSYNLSHSRNLQIVTTINNVRNDEHNTEINAFTELLKIDTEQSNPNFIRQFRGLKNTYPFINDLCQRKGFFGSIGYAFKGDNYRAERYKAIIDQLKQGSYNAQGHKEISYFGTRPDFKKAVCKKVEEIKNDYLAKTYTSMEDEIYKNDKIVFEELKNFNKNVGFKSPKVMSTDIQVKEDNNMLIWKEFVKVNPEYSILDHNNQGSEVFNIEGNSAQKLKQDVLKKLGLPDNTELFSENLSLGCAIKQQAATKIKSDFNECVVKKGPNLEQSQYQTNKTGNESSSILTELDSSYRFFNDVSFAYPELDFKVIRNNGSADGYSNACGGLAVYDSIMQMSVPPREILSYSRTAFAKNLKDIINDKLIPALRKYDVAYQKADKEVNIEQVSTDKYLQNEMSNCDIGSLSLDELRGIAKSIAKLNHGNDEIFSTQLFDMVEFAECFSAIMELLYHSNIKAALISKINAIIQNLTSHVEDGLNRVNKDNFINNKERIEIENSKLRIEFYVDKLSELSKLNDNVTYKSLSSELQHMCQSLIHFPALKEIDGNRADPKISYQDRMLNQAELELGCIYFGFSLEHYFSEQDEEIAKMKLVPFNRKIEDPAPLQICCFKHEHWEAIDGGMQFSLKLKATDSKDDGVLESFSDAADDESLTDEIKSRFLFMYQADGYQDIKITELKQKDIGHVLEEVKLIKANDLANKYSRITTKDVQKALNKAQKQYSHYCELLGDDNIDTAINSFQSNKNKLSSGNYTGSLYTKLLCHNMISDKLKNIIEFHQLFCNIDQILQFPLTNLEFNTLVFCLRDLMLNENIKLPAKLVLQLTEIHGEFKECGHQIVNEILLMSELASEEVKEVLSYSEIAQSTNLDDLQTLLCNAKTKQFFLEMNEVTIINLINLVFNDKNMSLNSFSHQLNNEMVKLLTVIGYNRYANSLGVNKLFNQWFMSGVYKDLLEIHYNAMLMQQTEDSYLEYVNLYNAIIHCDGVDPERDFLKMLEHTKDGFMVMPAVEIFFQKVLFKTIRSTNKESGVLLQIANNCANIEFLRKSYSQINGIILDNDAILALCNKVNHGVTFVANHCKKEQITDEITQKIVNNAIKELSEFLILDVNSVVIDQIPLLRNQIFQASDIMREVLFNNVFNLVGAQRQQLNEIIQKSVTFNTELERRSLANDGVVEGRGSGPAYQVENAIDNHVESKLLDYIQRTFKQIMGSTYDINSDIPTINANINKLNEKIEEIYVDDQVKQEQCKSVLQKYMSYNSVISKKFLATLFGMLQSIFKHRAKNGIIKEAEYWKYWIDGALIDSAIAYEDNKKDSISCHGGITKRCLLYIKDDQWIQDNISTMLSNVFIFEDLHRRFLSKDTSEYKSIIAVINNRERSKEEKIAQVKTIIRDRYDEVYKIINGIDPKSHDLKRCNEYRDQQLENVNDYIESLNEINDNTTIELLNKDNNSQDTNNDFKRQTYTDQERQRAHDEYRQASIVDKAARRSARITALKNEINVFNAFKEYTNNYYVDQNKVRMQYFDSCKFDNAIKVLQLVKNSMSDIPVDGKVINTERFMNTFHFINMDEYNQKLQTILNTTQLLIDGFQEELATLEVDVIQK